MSGHAHLPVRAFFRLVFLSAPALFAALAVLLLPGSAGAQEEGVWRVYLYGNEVSGLSARGEEVYSATGGGLVRFADGAFTQWNRAPQGLFSDSVVSVATGKDGRIWCGTRAAGISILEPGTGLWKPFNSVLAPIPDDHVQMIRITGTAQAETVLVGTAEGYAVFVNGETRSVCKKGIDICDIPSYDIRDLAGSGGEIWLATAAGICAQKADGTWALRTAGMGARTINRIVRGNSLYAGGPAGPFLWNGSAWEDLSEGLPRGFILRDLLPVGDTLYVAGVGDTLGVRNKGGVYRRVAGAWSRLGSDQPRDCVALTRTASGRIYSGAVDPDGVNDGIWEWNGQWTKHRVDGPSKRDRYLGLAFDGEGSLWLSSGRTGEPPLLTRYSTGAWKFFYPNTRNRTGTWGYGVRPAGGEVWVPHCCCYDTEEKCALERVRPAGPRFDNWPVTNGYDLDEDENGALWVGTFSDNDHVVHAHGLYRLDPADSTWTQISQENEPNLKSDQITAVRAAGRVIWIGYDHNGVSRFFPGADGVPRTADDTWIHYTSTASSNSLIGDNVRRIEIGPDGRVWVGTTAGLSILDGSTFTNISSGFGRLPAAEVNAIVPLSDGGAWVATNQAGITRLSRRATGGYTYTTFGPPNLPNPNVQAMVLGPDGQTVWIATDRGLASFRPPAQIVASAGGKVGVYPNPLYTSCVTSGQIDGVRLNGAGGYVRGVIADLSGRVVARFPAEGGDEALQDPGEPIWDGRNGGKPVPPGLYWIRVQTPHGVKSVGLAVIDAECGQ